MTRFSQFLFYFYEKVTNFMAFKNDQKWILSFKKWYQNIIMGKTFHKKMGDSYIKKS